MLTVQANGTAATPSRTALTPGDTHPASMLAKPSPVTGVITGTMKRFATTPMIEACPNTSNETGAVAMDAANDTAIPEAKGPGRTRSRRRCILCASKTRPATAANESWKPAENTTKGFGASTTTAASASTCRAIATPAACLGKHDEEQHHGGAHHGRAAHRDAREE